ncbi:hypothetical protein HYPSUDRAFT_416451 [Hypholoma sublateritium FD-334 SS-4]|uniref:F-box domain-containing protein n=1 Tax=Hypholoma sublateritium (strain FD-334 SS-4) TaxID=945553 RepID=A0A0D2KJI1_HYPSF|nr:hypothetical protein HYPSUDRAFT_416451 [Hypholoma sublateritium FD-334 SS-4]
MGRRRAKNPLRRKVSRPVVTVYDSDGEVVASPPHPTSRLDLVPLVPQKRATHPAIDNAPATSPARPDVLSQMPFDVFIEILGYLPTEALLALSRTSRLLQGVLHERSASGRAGTAPRGPRAVRPSAVRRGGGCCCSESTARCVFRLCV